jgi:Putative auto-transporter adhesin, head GIN domain
MKRLFFLTILFPALFTSCRYMGGERIRGNGNIKTESRTTGQFSSVDVSSNIDVYVKQDSVAAVKIETDENLLEYMQITVDGGTLKIREEKGYNLRPSKSIKVFVSGPSFKHFEVSGACDIYTENNITSTDPITINLSGACNVKMDLKTPKINVDLSGAGTITLKGETKDFIVDGSGSTDVKCFDLMTENADIEMSGAGDAEVFASVKLDVHVSGAADVKYKGNATVNQSVSGAGSVKKAE